MGSNLFNLALQFLGPFLEQQFGSPEDPDAFDDTSAKDKALLEVKNKEGSVGVLLGTRGMGKTNLAYRYALFLERPVYAVSPEQQPPDWITRVEIDAIEERVPKHSTLILDDLPAYASNRDYNTHLVQTLERIIPMCRHEREWHMIFCSQSAAQADKYILDADIAFFKPQGLLNADVERPFINKIYREAVNPIFEGRSQEWILRHAYCMTRSWKGVIEISKVD